MDKNEYKELVAEYMRRESILKQEVLDLIVAEIKQLVESNDEVWLDWDEATTRKHAKFTVFGNYKTPFCDKLISDGYCVGKCWRYPDYAGE